MKKILYTLITSAFLLIINCLLPTISFAQAGSLDQSFGSGGKVITSFGSASAYGYSTAIQSDGKILVAGFIYNGSKFSFALVRYKSNGNLDSTFGNAGKVTPPIGSSDDFGYSVGIQSDGKILVAGHSYIGPNSDFALVRYKSNGILDSTFGIAGKVTTAIGSADDFGYSVAIQSDGKILVAGSCYIGSNYDFALVRYKSNGIPDSTFGIAGKVTTAIGSANEFGYSVAIQSDGKILVAGYSVIGSTADFALVRYKSNGIPDSTFGIAGKVTTAVGSADEIGYSVAIQSDGKILVAGYSIIGSTYDFALVRYKNNGSLDSTFGSVGKVTTDIGISSDEGISVTIQSDGKILVAGYSENGSGSDFALVRYKSNGTLDNTFGSAGKVITVIGSDEDYGLSVAVQSDGKILVAGHSFNGNNYDFALVRYNGCSNTTGSRSVSSCNSYTSPSGKYTWTTSNTYKDTIPNAAGCDSLITINLTIKNSSSVSQTVSACKSYKSPSGKYIWKNSNIYKDTIPNTSGCDSIITINLTINTVDTSLTQSGKILTANASGAFYQWLNCNTGYSPILGAIYQSYTATVNGSYAVKVTKNGCSDTSLCRSINNVGTSEFQSLNWFNIYPNPFTEQTTLAFNEEQKNTNIIIMDMLGKEIKTINFSGKYLIIERGEMNKGIYIVQVIDGNRNVLNRKIIVQ